MVHSSGELFSLDGAVLVHDNRHELHWLFPNAVSREVVVRGEGPEASIGGRPVLPIAQHPDIVRVGITFPLDRTKFIH